MQTMRELLKQTWRNSNRPPSSDPPGTAKAPRRKKGKIGLRAKGLPSEWCRNPRGSGFLALSMRYA